MALYVHLSKMTRDGAAKIRNLAPEYGKWRSFVQSLGAKVIYAAACFGEYDFVVVVDYPNEVAAPKGSGCATALGVVQAQTLPAYFIEDFIKVMSAPETVQGFQCSPGGRTQRQTLLRDLCRNHSLDRSRIG